MSTKAETTAKNKILLLKALEKTMGNVTLACEKTNLSRTQHYEWLKDDKDYAEAVDMCREVAIDFTESKLMKNIEKGKEASIIFFLKTRAKDRGYVEKQEIVQTSHVTVDWSDEDESKDKEA